MAYEVTTGPASEPLTSTEVKNHLKVDFTTDDDLITTLIESARQWAEDELNMGLLPQTVKETFDCFPKSTAGNPNQLIFLSLSPVRSITDITYTDEDGTPGQTVSTSAYTLSSYHKPPVIGLKLDQEWPDTSEELANVIVEYTIGYDDTDSIPSNIKQAMLMKISEWYEKRADYASRYKSAAEKLLHQRRVTTV